MADNANNLREINRLLERAVGLTEQQKESYRQLAQGIKEGSNASKEFETLQRNILRDIKEASQAVYEVRDAFAASVDELKGMNSGLSRTKKAFQGLESISSKLVEDASGRNRLSLKQLKNIENQVKQKLVELKLANDFNQRALEENKLAIDNLGTSKKELKQKEKLEKENTKIKASIRATNQELSKTEGLNEDLIKQAKVRIAQEEEINKKLGATPAILEGIGKALQKIGLPDFGISDSIAEAKELLRVRSDELKLEGKKLKTSEALSTVTGQVVKGIGKQLSFSNLIQGSFTLLVSSMIQLDKLTGDLARNIGISYNESLAMQKNFNQIAISSDEIMVSTAEINKSFNFLNKQFGGTTKFSNELLQSFTALTAQAGFTQESIGNIAMLTGTQGDELKNNVSLMQGELQVMNEQNKTSFSSKQLVEEIGKINKATLLTLRNQPKALARTLYTSKKLALSFAEMESISSSLLDFESSIQNELEAELLTGKNLNLEQARLLALKGDVAGASAEIAKQVGTAADFENMSVIQQEALAKAAGLTREQLAKSLTEREALVKLGGKDKSLEEAYNRLRKDGLNDQQIAEELGMKQLDGQIKSNAIQARFTAAVERAKELFLDIGSALMPVVSAITDMVVGIAKFVANFGPLIKFLGVAYGIFRGIAATMKIIKFFSNDVFRTQVMSNAAARVGLITEEEALLAQKAQAMQGNKIMNIKKMKNMYEKQSLSNVVQESVQQKMNNALGVTGVAQTQAKGAAKKANLATDIASNTAEKTNNTLNATGNLISKRGLVLGKSKLAQAVATAAAFAIANPITALAGLAVAAGVGALVYSQMKDGVIGPGAETIVSGPKGSIQLDKEDSMIVGTDLGGKKSGREGRRAERTGENNQKIIDLLTTQNNFLKTIAAKSTSIIMNGNEVGQGINTSERAIQ
jgi:hypothetical protein